MALVTNTGDVVEAAVGIADIAHDDPVVGAKLRQRLGIADEVALEVIDGDPQGLANHGRACQHARRRLDPDLDRFAQELRGWRSSATRRGANAPSVSTWNPLQMPTTGPPARATTRPRASPG